MSLRINLLGEFQLAIDGADGRPRGRKARGLVAYLAVAQDQTVSRDRAADLLWSDRGSEQARGSLRQTLAELRAGHPLLRDAIHIARDLVGLVPGQAEVDIDVILDAARRADAPTLAKRLEGADAFLVDLSGLSPAYEEWLQVERPRQNDRILVAVSSAVPAMIGTASQMDIQSILRSLDRLDPWNETVARLGFEADHAAGDTASLHKRYKRLTEGLQREFGVPPSGETRSLFDRLTGAPESVPAAATQAQDTTPPTILISPISVIGDDPTAQELAAIVTDDIRTALKQHADLRVLTLAPGDLERVERVCQKAVAAYMLSGRIRRIGDDVRVNLQIGSIASSAVVWSEQIKVDIADLGAAVDEVVERAAGAVLPAIDHDLAAKLRQADFGDRAIASLYTKARGLVGRGQDFAETKAGVDLLETIVEQDARHIGARMLLARLYNNDLWQRVAGHDVEAYRARALALTEEVAALVPDDGRIQLRLAWCQLRQRQWARAERGLRSAAARLSYDADGLNECAAGLFLLGELDLAEPLMQRAFRLNPFAPGDYHADRAIFLMLRGDPVSAEEHFDISGERSPLYLYARLLNMTRLPGHETERARLRDDFTTSFAKAWQLARPASLADVAHWIDYTYPLRQPEHVALFKDNLAAALGPDWTAKAHNAP